MTQTNPSDGKVALGVTIVTARRGDFRKERENGRI